MRTGPSKSSTRELAVDLEKHGKKAKKKVWLVLSKRISHSTRNRVTVNLYKLSKLSEKHRGKTLAVPGKVLSKGEATAAMKVACFACSGKAKNKIEEAGGKIISLKELIAQKPKENTLLVVQ